MLHQKYNLLKAILVLMVFISACSKKEEIKKPDSSLSENFESGSIGEFEKISNTEWNLYLANDNNNPDLPDRWRNWWYVKLENITIDDTIEITLKNRGWPTYYLPVYSYDQKEWNQFTEKQVSQNLNEELIIKKQFEKQNVWIARFYPYTFTDLKKYIDDISENPNIQIQIPDNSQNGRPIYALKITNFDISNSSKKRILLHARTHPAEVPPSFMLEGMINFLLSNSTEAASMLSEFEFHIFPMQNVDGVIEGNYRSTPQTENLEVMWFYDSENPLNLNDESPKEIKIIHDYALELMNDDGPAISMALNLHASNGEPDIRTFFYPHFGEQSQGYSTTEAALWEKQISLISSFATHFGSEMIEPIPSEGGSSFASKTYPESWWWANYNDQVLAMTMEMTYGRSGFSPRWIEPNDLREMGRSLALGIRDYYNPDLIKTSLKTRTDKYPTNNSLKYPEIYAPSLSDEGKN